MSDELVHYGTPRRSGRYPWGSGDTPQRNKDFLSYVRELKKQGLTDKEIADGMEMSTTQLRAKRTIAIAEKRKADVAEARRLFDKGYSRVAIGEKMGRNESSIRALLDPTLQERSSITEVVAKSLQDRIEKVKYLDVGEGVEANLGISATKLKVAVAMLQEQGYVLHYVKYKQLGTGKMTLMKVLTAPDVPYSEVYRNSDKIGMVTDYSEDGGRTVLGLEPPRQISSDRIKIRYAEEGGKLKDGVIELRRGVPEISLGDAHYAQVRIGVDGTHYMKGMAIYGDIPDGYDIVYNTKKTLGSSKDKVFKLNEPDADNPFGAIVRQKHYLDADGKEQLSALNRVGSKEGSGEEGSWAEWQKSLSSQVLSKQTYSLAKKQLDEAFGFRKDEFDEINSLTNPAIKKVLLNSLADKIDADAVHLKAAALPRQASQVLLPLNSLKENEVYAPNYLPGENVVLIRHPHGGIFEIPELIVNNRNKEGKAVIGNAKDAIGINPEVAKKLSGADFDGDTVIVIPNKGGVIKTSASLRGLKDFDPSAAYPKTPGMKVMKDAEKQIKMGEISNLITDMTIKGAKFEEIAAAVRHSMCIIDAPKHELDYQRSYKENGIAALKKRYQGSERGGAATLISRAKSPKLVNARKEGITIVDPATGKKKRLLVDPDTGEKLYTETGETYTYKTVKNPTTGKKERVYDVPDGVVVTRKEKSTKMAETKDAFTLSSGTKMETIYAEHANKLKALANEARKVSVNTKDISYSPSAKETYAKEASALRDKLVLAVRNKPYERKAHLLANKVISTKRNNNPNITPAQLKKLKGEALVEMRLRTGAKKQKIDITDREWEAIQAGAISAHALYQILQNTDLAQLKTRALPREYRVMSPTRVSRARSMLSAGHTRGEVADALGVSISSLDDALK